VEALLKRNTLFRRFMDSLSDSGGKKVFLDAVFEPTDVIDAWDKWPEIQKRWIQEDKSAFLRDRLERRRATRSAKHSMQSEEAVASGGEFRRLVEGGLCIVDANFHLVDSPLTYEDSFENSEPTSTSRRVGSGLNASMDA
jgi:hypothetical protein